MLSIFQKCLEKSLQLQKHSSKIIRLAGKILGIIPTAYAAHLEKKILGEEDK